MSTTPYHRVELAAADRDRVHRRSEEVLGRLEEMARMAARALSRRLDPAAVRQFVPHEPGPTDLPPAHHVEITQWPDGTSICVIYLDGGGIVVEHPCGLAG
jgi:hypothetical protein